MPKMIKDGKKLSSKERDEIIRKTVWDNILNSYDYINVMGVYTLVKLDNSKKHKRVS